MKEIIYHNDPSDPLYGQTTEIDRPYPPKPEFKTLTGSQFVALVAGVLGFDRTDQLLQKSDTVATLIQKAEKVDRMSGNTPAAIAYLQSGSDALTNDELDAIDTAWRAAS